MNIIKVMEVSARCAGIAATGSIHSPCWSHQIQPRISLVASSNFPSSGSLYRLFTMSSYFIIASLLAGEYGIVIVNSIGRHHYCYFDRHFENQGRR